MDIIQEMQTIKLENVKENQKSLNFTVPINSNQKQKSQ